MRRLPRGLALSIILILTFCFLQASSVYGREKNEFVLPLTWENTGQLSTKRMWHTLSLLADGKALAAGGFFDDGSPHYLNSSEIYDPYTGAWSLAGNMVTARSQHTATVLLDGRILVTGGLNGQGATSSAELFDPSTRTWTATGSMAQARYSHTATRLNDGRVLVAGGCLTELNCLVGVEIYNPATGGWDPENSMPSGARKDHTAVLLLDGSVLVAGGRNTGGTTPTYYNSSFRYFPATNQWTVAGSMREYRYKHTAVLQRDGKVMVVGGRSVPFFGLASYPNTTEAYNPATNIWSKLQSASMVDIIIDYGRIDALGVLDAFGSFLLFGGYDGTTAGSVQYRSLNNDTDNWHPHGILNRARYNAAAVQLSNGAILIAGGQDDNGAIAYAEINQPRAGATELNTGTGLLGTVYSSGTLMPNGDILFTGGANEAESGQSKPCHKWAYLWLNADEAIDGLPEMHTERCFHTTTLLPDGRVVVIGGTLATGGSAAGAGEIWNGETWTQLSGPSFGHPKTALLPDGLVLIIDASTRPHGYLFNPKDLSFRPTIGEYTGLYSSFTLTLMNNGKALILGSSGSDVIEVYDPQTETFSTVPGLPDRRIAHTATLMPDGKVLIAGGRYGSGPNQGQPIRAVYLFNPTVTSPSDPWSILASLTDARYNHSAVLLPDGRLAVLGGQLDASGDSIDSVELYSPADNMWRVVGTLLAERASHKTLLSAKGKLVTFGGYGDGYAARTTVEQFIFTNVSTSGLFWRPTITDAACLYCFAAKQIEVTGSGFANAPESSSGSTAQAPTNFPLVQIMRLDNQQILWLMPGTPSSDTHFRSAPIPTFPSGPVMVYVYSKGSAQGKVLLLSDAAFKVHLPLVKR